MVQIKEICLIGLISLSFSCDFTGIVKNKSTDLTKNNLEIEVDNNSQDLIHEIGTHIDTRFETPKNYERFKLEDKSFASFLRRLPLKVHGSKVRTYSGNIKPNYSVYEAVIDLPIGSRDLHQCADAVMRLRADYFWQNERYDDIHFNFTNGWRADYAEWMKGKRVVLDGNVSYWVQKKPASNSYQDYWKYMEVVFSYAGTLSLDKELESVEIENMQIGDVFIRGGSPGHAVIVVDMCENIGTGEKLFMLAQSYMPAQELQVLQNPSNRNWSPWYSFQFADVLKTPEWSFHRTELKRFKEDK